MAFWTFQVILNRLAPFLKKIDVCLCICEPKFTICRRFPKTCCTDFLNSKALFDLTRKGLALISFTRRSAEQFFYILQNGAKLHIKVVFIGLIHQYPATYTILYLFYSQFHSTYIHIFYYTFYLFLPASYCFMLIYFHIIHFFTI